MSPERLGAAGERPVSGDAPVSYMAEALRLAERGRYSTHPNPNVGCLIVRDGEVVGRGWHACAGGPHAEVFALREAGPRARGADVYVTLEPCSHHGRTPPCAEALVEAGVRRVTVAMSDPNPRVAGQGLERLRAAGIEVECGLLEARARALNVGYISRRERSRPWVRLKLAASLDGRTAMASGESRWITGPDARRDVQRLRARSSAIVTGINTVLADDPSLNVRLAPGELAGVEPLRQPLRVVLDTQLRTPAGAKLLALDGQTLVMTASDNAGAAAALQAAGAEVARLEADAGGLKPARVLAELAAREINEVLLECGPTLAGAFLAAGLIDEIVVYLAPHVMGDAARGLFALPALARMQERIKLQWVDVRRVGNDLRLTLKPLPRD